MLFRSTSRRTKEALAAARKRGVRLGNPNGAAALLRAGKGNGASRGAATAKANGKAGDLKPVLEAVLADGVRSLAGIAAEFNRRGITTPRGKGAGQWYPSSVRNLAARLSVSLQGSS